MSTLTTRIAGYRFTMRPATGEEIASHRATSQEQGWTLCPDYSRAMVGNFVSETGNVMDLPFELRCTRMLVSPDIMLQLFETDVEILRERVGDVASRHDWFYGGCNTPCGCESCVIANAMFAREHMAGRKSLI